LPPTRFFNAVYTWMIGRVGDREEFDMLLEEPIPGVEAEARPGTELAEFGAFVATMTAG
jgi:hypothetical protein